MSHTIEQMESLETTLADMYGKKTGKTTEDIKATYFDGKDHWLTAKEALQLGFIDAIYDADPIPEEATTKDIYNIFNNRLQSHNNNNRMNLDELRKKPRFKDCATDADILRVVDKLEQDAAQVVTLSENLTAANAALKVFQDKAKADDEASKKKLLDEAEVDGRINAQTRPTFAALLNADLENGTAALNALQKKVRVMDELGKLGDPASAWDAKWKDIQNRNKPQYS
jgi:hypothetical protein